MFPSSKLTKNVREEPLQSYSLLEKLPSCEIVSLPYRNSTSPPVGIIQIDRFFVCFWGSGLWLLLFDSRAHTKDPIISSWKNTSFSVAACKVKTYEYLEYYWKIILLLSRRWLRRTIFFVCWWLIKINCYKEFIDPDVWCVSWIFPNKNASLTASFV